MRTQKVAIKFKILSPQKLQGAIYNCNGEKVKELITGIYQEGEYQIVWDLKDNTGKYVPAGLYFYKLENNNGVKLIEPLLL